MPRRSPLPLASPALVDYPTVSLNHFGDYLNKWGQKMRLTWSITMRRRPDAPNGESYIQATSAASTIWYMSGRQGPCAAALPADGLAILAVIGGATVDAADGLLAAASAVRRRERPRATVVNPA